MKQSVIEMLVLYMYRLDPSRSLKKKYFLDNGNRNSIVLHMWLYHRQKIFQTLFLKACTFRKYVHDTLAHPASIGWHWKLYTIHKLYSLSYRRIFLERLTAKNSSDCSHPKEYFCPSLFFSDAFSSLVTHRIHCSTEPKWNCGE